MRVAPRPDKIEPTFIRRRTWRSLLVWPMLRSRVWLPPQAVGQADQAAAADLMMAPSPDVLAGRHAYDRRAWRAAYDALRRADRAVPLSGPDLWRLAMAASLTGHDPEFYTLLERAHDAHAATGEHTQAARCAFWIGFRLATRGEVGPASGWLGRAARLIEREGRDCVEHGYLLLPVAFQHLTGGDAEGAYEAAAAAAGIGDRFGDPDLLALALHVQGRARMSQARVSEGLALLDEAMVAVTSQRLSPHVSGLIYCSVIGACRRVYELRRAHEWTAALRDWCDEQPELVAFSGECHAYRAELMNLHGDWRGAIEVTRRACDLRDSSVAPAAVAAAFYQRGEAHRLLGDLAAAEEAYRNASRLGREPQPGLALLRLERGDADAAAATLRRVLGETSDPLQRARMLPALCEILLAAGDVAGSRSACDELADIAARFPADALDTMVAHARGSIALAEGDAASALMALRSALRGWQAIDAPFESARVRILIARACEALSDRDGARLELDDARAALEALGARADLARLGVAGVGARANRPHGLTPREAQVLAVIATGLSNRAAAAALGISEKTVARHLSNIFGKLGISSRAAATAFAYEHDLLQPPA